MRPRLTVPYVLTIATTAALVASCQSKPTPTGPDRSALSTMERVALGANACWFKSADPAFAAYKLAPELNSFSGRPRILVVHKGSPESRPLLVVQAEGNPSKLDAFGPMMDSPTGPRIVHDVTRWASGGKACS
ncbi:hypothetical protein [Rhizobium sp. S96]|uniref:hypothetical protein n=1 Tax=Rhizobium sp. S96 TaxID=3055140 RepID=UPI0025AAC9EE|nr:hypothetical protein [Rhizobium sp. S96]MDM9623557.1 hypothetical protein [Rhizobium sp. S96]